MKKITPVGERTIRPPPRRNNRAQTRAMVKSRAAVPSFSLTVIMYDAPGNSIIEDTRVTMVCMAERYDSFTVGSIVSFVANVSARRNSYLSPSPSKLSAHNLRAEVCLPSERHYHQAEGNPNNVSTASL